MHEQFLTICARVKTLLVFPFIKYKHTNPTARRHLPQIDCFCDTME